MRGLSITAIGQRSINTCIEIYQNLQQPLKLDYLELAIGSHCDLSQIPPDIPLVIHDRCLYDKGNRLPFSLVNSNTWANYKNQLRDRQVLLLSIHPPKLHEASAAQVIALTRALEDFMQVQVVLEVMPSINYWLSQYNLLDLPLLLDISHINIWHCGVEAQVAKTVAALLPRAKAIHVSHNNGQDDSHELIPNGIWFESLLDSWAKTQFVSYESLPEVWSQYERLDKKHKVRRAVPAFITS